MDTLPVLRFKPLLQSVVWGGARLNSLLGRELPDDRPFGESWELVDLPEHQSIAVGGPFDGEPIHRIIARRGPEFLGTAGLLGGRHPLLFKFIDAQQTLSVQVHPDAAACQRLGNGARPKTEAWYIIDCNPGSVVYAGLKQGVDRRLFQDALETGTVAELLHQVPVKPGDCIFLSAGTVHAIGEGIVLAEVQQSSDTTYRVFDWNRTGLDGQPRMLHFDEALESINYQQVGPPAYMRPVTGRKGVYCRYFSMEIICPAGQISEELHDTGPVVIMGVRGAGTVTVRAGGFAETVGLGQTIVVPACISEHIVVEGSGGLTCLATGIPRKDVADSLFP